MNNTELEGDIGYLEAKDIDSQGNLVGPDVQKYIPQNVPVVIMFQASWCGHCKHTKPTFQQLCNENKGKIFCATVQDDEKSGRQQQVSKMFSNGFPGVDPIRGYPTFLGYKNGKFVKEYNGNRSKQSLYDFAMSL